MSGILESILGAANGGAIGQISKQFGLGESQAKAAIESLLPAISRRVQKNAQTPEGLQGLASALKSGNHQKYLDQPELIGAAETEAEGNGILAHIMGSKDVSRRVAQKAAQRSGVDEGILKKMLPNVAAMAMGAMGKQTASGGALSALTGGGGGGALSALTGGGGAASLLSGFLGGGGGKDDDDGFDVGDAVNIAKKLF